MLDWQSTARLFSVQFEEVEHFISQNKDKRFLVFNHRAGVYENLLSIKPSDFSTKEDYDNLKKQNKHFYFETGGGWKVNLIDVTMFSCVEIDLPECYGEKRRWW